MEYKRWHELLLGSIIGVVVIAVLVGVAMLFPNGRQARPSLSEGEESTTTIQVVAAENVWGNLAHQLGGSRVHVVSIMTNPSADPHQFESSAATAREFAHAEYVIVNGAGYDAWAQKLLEANANVHPKVLNVATLLGKHAGDNPHFWYSPTDVNLVAGQITRDLASLDPGGASYFVAEYARVLKLLASYESELSRIRAQYGGTKVAATEDIAAYLANASGLDLVSPPAFTQAVAQGVEPSAQSIATFQRQLEDGTARVLIYNKQAVTPLTARMKAIAQRYGVPVVDITETIDPATATFQSWMGAQTNALSQALASATGR